MITFLVTFSFTVFSSLPIAAEPNPNAVLATYSSGNLTGSQLHDYINSNFGSSIIDPRGRTDAIEYSKKVILDTLRDYGIAASATEETFKKNPGLSVVLRDVEATELNHALLNDYLVEKQRPTEEELKAVYERDKNRFTTPETYRFQHLFTNGGNTDETRKQARSRIEKAQAELKSGKDFETVAAQYSEVKSRVGSATDILEAPKGKLSQQMDWALGSMKAGETSDIIETRFGYEILYLIEKKPETVMPYEQARSIINAEILNERLTAAQKVLEASAEKFIPVVLHPENLKADADPSLPLFVVNGESLTVGDYRWLQQLHGKNIEISNPNSADELRKWAEVYRNAAYAKQIKADQVERINNRLNAARIRNIAEFYLVLQANTRYGNPDEAVLKEYYQAHAADFVRPMMFSGWRMGFVPRDVTQLPPPDRHAVMEKAQAQAKEVRERILKGENMAALAKALSTLPDATQGGYLESAPSHGALFDIHTEKLKPGEISEPVIHGDQIYLFKLERRLPERPLRYEEAREEVVRIWLAEKRKEIDAEYTEKFARENNVKIDEEAVKKWLQELFPDWKP